MHTYVRKMFANILFVLNCFELFLMYVLDIWSHLSNIFYLLNKFP